MILFHKKSISLFCCICWFSFQSHAQLTWEKPTADIAFPSHDFALKGDTLYGAGWFGFLGTDTVSGVIKYHNGEWTGVGNSWGVVGRSEALAVYRDTLYVGGISHGSLKKWTGTQWELLPGLTIQMNGPFEVNNPNIYDLKVIDDELWVVGVFDSIGGIAANGIARWNGQIWQSGYDAPSTDGPLELNFVNCVIEYKNEIYVAGNLNGDTLSEIMKYNGTEWTSVGGGIRDHGPAFAGNLTIYHDELYVVGHFLKATGNADNNVMRWNGTEWLPCGGGVSDPVVGATVHDDKLWVTGFIETAGGVNVNYLTCWDGEQWCSTGNEFSFPPQTLTSFKDTLYVSGKFHTIDNDSIPILAMWPGNGSLDSCGVELLNIESPDDSPNASFQLYPNPADDILHLKLEVNTEQAKVKIIDLRGKLVKDIEHITPNNVSFSFSVEDLSPGVYFVVVEHTMDKKIQKLVKN